MGWLSVTLEADCAHAEGLADALMARLPVAMKSAWRIGHPVRALPAGYLYARETGDVSLMHPALGFYYGQLRKITQGELFTMERLRAISAFQAGLYDDALAAYERD